MAPCNSMLPDSCKPLHGIILTFHPITFIAMALRHLSVTESSLKLTFFKIAFKFPRGQWLNILLIVSLTFNQGIIKLATGLQNHYTFTRRFQICCKLVRQVLPMKSMLSSHLVQAGSPQLAETLANKFSCQASKCNFDMFQSNKKYD